MRSRSGSGMVSVMLAVHMNKTCHYSNNNIWETSPSHTATWNELTASVIHHRWQSYPLTILVNISKRNVLQSNMIDHNNKPASTDESINFTVGFIQQVYTVWVAGKTVWSPCYTRAISERFRGAARRSAIQIHVYFTLLYPKIKRTILYNMHFST